MPKFTASLNLPKYSSAPSSPTDGDVYYNTTDHKVYSRINGAWVDLGATAAAGGGAEVFYQTSAPSTPSAGDIWVDSDYDTSPRNAVAYQTSAPSSPMAGDLWIDSDDNTVTREAFYYQNSQPSTPMVGDIWVDSDDNTTSSVIPTGSTSVVGIVQLTDSTSSTSTTTAATPNSVKAAYDLANNAISPFLLMGA